MYYILFIASPASLIMLRSDLDDLLEQYTVLHVDGKAPAVMFTILKLVHVSYRNAYNIECVTYRTAPSMLRIITPTRCKLQNERHL